MKTRVFQFRLFAMACLCFFTHISFGQTESGTAPASEITTAASEKGEPKANRLVRLSPTEEVWLDRKKKRVIVGGKICLRKGLLEMFACPRGTKEHESIVAVNAKSSLVHTALLAAGSKPGSPVSYDPKYVAATGPIIDVDIAWKDENGKTIKRRAQEMIRHVKTRKPMKEDWVFAGSGFWKDEETGEEYYMAEGGEMICLSNFSTAMMDLTVESPQENASLFFEALTDQIPPLGTEVRMILTPRQPRKPAPPTSPSS